MPEVPLYQKIANELRTKIEESAPLIDDQMLAQRKAAGADVDEYHVGLTKALTPGAQLPPESDLAEHFNVSRNTVRDAVRWLKGLGLVETQPGRGTFVAEKPRPFQITLTVDSETGFSGGEGTAYIAEVSAQGRSAKTSPPTVEIKEADPVKAGALQLPVGTHLVSRHQRRYIDDTPWSLQTSYYPLDFLTKGATELASPQDISMGAVAYLGETLGITQAAYTDKITVRAPDETEIKFFNLPINGSVPVYETFRTGLDSNGKPFRLTVSVFPTDRNEFYIHVELPTPRDADAGPRQKDGKRSEPRSH